MVAARLVPVGIPAPDGLRLRHSADSTVLLRRQSGPFDAHRLLLLWQRAVPLPLQRPAGFARRSVPVRGEQVGSRSGSVPSNSRTDNTKSSLAFSSGAATAVTVAVPSVSLAQADSSRLFLPAPRLSV